MRYFLPFYHTVSDRPQSHIKHLYRVKCTSDFKKDIDTMCKLFEPVGLEQFRTAVKTDFREVKKPIMHLSFDDGLTECATTIAPILLEKGIPATFFINSAFLDNRNLFFRFKASLIVDSLMTAPIGPSQKKELQSIFPGSSETDSLISGLKKINYAESFKLDKAAELLGVNFNDFLQTHQPYLTTNQIKSLENKGFSIGAHSVDHPQFGLIPFNEQIAQVRNCFETLHPIVGLSIKAFSFPFTDDGVSLTFFRHIFDNGIADITFGTAGMKNDMVRNNFQRVAMENYGNAALAITANYAKRQLRRIIGHNLILRNEA